MEKKYIEINNLKTYYPVKSGLFNLKTNFIKAVDDVTLSIDKGRTFALVGESGCGKTTMAKTIMGLEPVTSGNISIEGKTIDYNNKNDLRKLRRNTQIIFQNPDSSLNPRMKAGEIIGEAVRISSSSAVKVKETVLSLLSDVGMHPEDYDKYPHEFSGGQKQRIGIARALAVKPVFIICDEPVASLDVSIQAQIINLLKDLQKKHDITYLFISHDLSVVRYLADQVAVMYLGKIVELAETEEIFVNPKHPYTKALLSAIPVPDPGRKRKRIILKSNVPSALNPPPGCLFHTRCPYVFDDCRHGKVFSVSDNGHYVLCNLERR